ncbi:hypothetical protein ACFWN7_00475 [Agromyces sp. NPDC058484]|uniref:hypothetical protein n=1 Tax=Agromyces sp. NPDC058484 TaxID=3346524 RepID=UPI00365B55A9
MDVARLLLSGPRGRRLCLELAMALDPGVREMVFQHGYDLDPGRGSSRIRLVAFAREDEPHDPAQNEPTGIDGLVDRLISLGAFEVDDASVASPLVRSVDTARYWQEPDGEDCSLPSQKWGRR